MMVELCFRATEAHDSLSVWLEDAEAADQIGANSLNPSNPPVIWVQGYERETIWPKDDTKEKTVAFHPKTAGIKADEIWAYEVTEYPDEHLEK